MARPIHGGEIKNDLDSVAQYYGLGNKLPNVLEKTKGIRDLPGPLMKALGQYCCEDVRLTELVFFELRHYFPQDELDLIHYTVKAYCEPVIKVDKNIATQELIKAQVERATILESVPYDIKQLRSRDQFAAALEKLGVDPPLKISPANGKWTYAFAKTDENFIKLKSHRKKSVRNLVLARENVASSISETRAARVISHADPALPIYLNYGKAHTLRWTGGDKMNPQNFEREGQLRHALTAPRGCKFVIVDSAQIEARMNAWMAEEEELLEGFRNGDDVYSEFAADEIYEIPLKKVTKTQRFVGKVGILGLGYYMGAEKLQHTLETGQMGPPVFLDDGEYYKIVYAYRKKYPLIKKQWATADDILYKMYNKRKGSYRCLTYDGDKLFLPSGMFLRYPNLRQENRYGRGEDPIGVEYRYGNNLNIYGGLLVENWTQALARNLVAEQILQVADRYRVVMMVHDEVILCVKTREARRALKETLAAFHHCPEWAKGLPVAGEGAITDYYQKL
jgi:hypothetical protein